MNRLEDIIYPHQAAEIVPPDILRMNIKRIIILPRPDGVDDYQELVSADFQVPRGQHRVVCGAARACGGDCQPRQRAGFITHAIDPDTGKVDMQHYLEPQGALMAEITGEAHTDAVLEIEISKVKAEVRGGIASWDDRKEPVASTMARALTPIPGLAKGWVYAASVDMKLWDPTGKLLWRKRRGFATLGEESGLSGKYRERPLKEVYGNSAFMQQWLVDMLSQLAPPVHGVEPNSQPAQSPRL